MKNFFSLLWLNFRVGMSNAAEFLKVVARYWTNRRFLLCDLSLLASYFGKNPYRVNKQFLQEKGFSDLYTYGETPLTTMELIAARCAMSSTDTFLELGCGRGRSCFWIRCFKGCKTIGVDFVPEFIRIAKLVGERSGLDRLDFLCEDYRLTSLNGATVIYYYSTCSSKDEIEEMIARFKKCPQGTKIITVSYALSEYTQEPAFETLKVFSARFQWGWADVYIQMKK